METTAGHSRDGYSDRPRKLYMVLSPRSLSHANLALKSLFRNSVEPVHLVLITDSADDKKVLTDSAATPMESGEPIHSSPAYSPPILEMREKGAFSPLSPF